jgi:hypothetical protein
MRPFHVGTGWVLVRPSPETFSPLLSHLSLPSHTPRTHIFPCLCSAPLARERAPSPSHPTPPPTTALPTMRGLTVAVALLALTAVAAGQRRERRRGDHEHAGDHGVKGFIRVSGNKFVDEGCGDFVPVGWNSASWFCFGWAGAGWAEGVARRPAGACPPAASWLDCWPRVRVASPL